MVNTWNEKSLILLDHLSIFFQDLLAFIIGLQSIFLDSCSKILKSSKQFQLYIYFIYYRLIIALATLNQKKKKNRTNAHDILHWVWSVLYKWLLNVIAKIYFSFVNAYEFFLLISLIILRGIFSTDASRLTSYVTL